MEPWHFSHGEPDRPGELRRFPFTLQWSHGILAMESRDSRRNSSQPHMLQWSHGILAMERCAWIDAMPVQIERFNGAMAF